MSTTLSDALTFQLKNWKSSVKGILTAVTVTGGYFAAVPTATLQQHGITQNEIFWATVVVGLANVYLHLITKDAQ